MKYYFLLIIFLAGYVSPNEGIAQENRATKIYLKNGVRIKGAILESTTNTAIKVRIENQIEPVAIKYDHIKKIKFRGYGNLNEEMDNRIGSVPGLHLNSFYHEIRGGLLFGEENLDVSIHSLNGYQFSKYLGTGLGVGVNKFGNYVTLPIYATIKGYLKDGSVSPFYFGDIGYGFAWDTNKNKDFYIVDDVQGGLYWQLGFGYQFNFYKSALVLSLGYINQESSADYRTMNWWGTGDIEVSEKRLLRRVSFTVGILF
jgi:hypothetical protein